MTFHSWDAPFPLEHASTLPCVQSFDLWSSPCHFCPFFLSTEELVQTSIIQQNAEPWKTWIPYCALFLGKVLHTMSYLKNLSQSIWLCLTSWNSLKGSFCFWSNRVFEGERIVVKPALNEAWGSFFCHCQCVFFDERAAALRSILHDHDSWRCLTWVHRSTFLKRRNVWHRNWHRIAWPWEAECFFSPPHGRFNDSVSQPFWRDRLTRCLWIAQLEDCIVFSVGHGGDSRYLGKHRNNVNGKPGNIAGVNRAKSCWYCLRHGGRLSGRSE